MAEKPTCVVDGCGAKGVHERTWTLARAGWGEIDVSGIFCCTHIDMLDSEQEPHVDLYVSGQVRA